MPQVLVDIYPAALEPRPSDRRTCKKILKARFPMLRVRYPDLTRISLQHSQHSFQLPRAAKIINRHYQTFTAALREALSPRPSRNILQTLPSSKKTRWL